MRLHRDIVEDLGVDGRIISKLFFKKSGGEAYTELTRLSRLVGEVAGACECGSEF
jgi:hypothetical protein